MSALLAVSAGCAAYAAFGCLHAASVERLPPSLRPRLTHGRWRALMHATAGTLLLWALLAFRAHETLYAGVIEVCAVLTLAGS